MKSEKSIATIFLNQVGNPTPSRVNFMASSRNWDHKLTHSDCWNIDFFANYNSPMFKVRQCREKGMTFEIL